MFNILNTAPELRKFSPMVCKIVASLFTQRHTFVGLSLARS